MIPLQHRHGPRKDDEPKSRSVPFVCSFPADKDGRATRPGLGWGLGLGGCNDLLYLLGGGTSD